MMWGNACRVACRTRARITVQKRCFHTTSPAFSKRDPFEVLGIKRGASKRAIKKAYFDKAKAHHPDQNSGASSAQFLEIQEAYESLQGIVTVRATTTTSTTTTYEEEKPRTWGTHGYASNEHDAYQRGRRNDPNYQETTYVFNDTVQVGHIPLVFVAQWDSDSSSLLLKTHSFKTRATPNSPTIRNEESMFASVRHSKLDNGSPCIDLLWEDGHIIAKCYSQKDGKFHNPKANTGVEKNTKDKTITKVEGGKKMVMEDGKMVVEDAEGNVMGHITPNHSWLKRVLTINNAEGINVGKATWPRFSSQMIECEDEYGKKVATGILQDKRWVIHLSPLASMSQYEVSPLFWIFSCFWAH